MKLKEFEGMRIFKQYGIPVPNGILVHDPAVFAVHAKDLPATVMVKAQVLYGKRKKQGLIRSCKKAEAKNIIEELLKKVPEVLVEEQLIIDKELYASMTMNRAERCLTLLFSDQGGVNIEELAVSKPEAIVRLNLPTFNKKEVEQALPEVSFRGALVHIFFQLFRIAKELDAQLVEINPLVLSRGSLIAADAKIILDDNALFRHPEFSQQASKEFTALEKKAREQGLAYVELDGNIGIIGNGAGLVMASLDVVEHFGGRPANFCDIGGGTGAEVMERALEIILEKSGIQGLFINIFAGITHCDEIAEGIIRYKNKHGLTIPITIRMIGTNEQEAVAMLEKEGLHPMHSMEAGAKKIVELTK